MVAAHLLVASVIAAASATRIGAREDAYFTSLLKRQEPGTPAYNCHDNCGSAITLSRGADPCTNPLFITDYINCLKCSGPDNYNIWRYYGGTLSSAGEKCGLDAEPLAGKQDDVPEAGSTGAVSSAAPSQTSSAALTSTVPSPVATAPAASAPASESAAPASSQSAATTETPSETPVFSPTSSSAENPAVITSAISSTPFHPTSIMNATLSTSSGASSPTSSHTLNTTASSTATQSAPAEVTANAAAGLVVRDLAGIFGAIVVGVVIGL